MPLVALGINHKSAPVAVREKIAFAPERLSDALWSLKRTQGVHEAAILSTCNRTEIYCNGQLADLPTLSGWLSHYHTMPANELRPYLYEHPDHNAVRHLLRVASGLDSLVLGEPQILGQVKSAYQSASEAGTLGKNLERLFQHSFAVAKQVRSDTQIGASPVSVAYAAVSLAKQVFADLSEHSALLVGAGETIGLVAQHLADKGIKRLIIANRTVERARQLAVPLNGYAISLAEVPAHLADADLVISSTASPTSLLDKAIVERALQGTRRRAILMIDIAVPRDIEAEVGEMDDIYLYTVDDLQSIIADNLRSRQAAAEQAEEIIDVQTDNFLRWLRAQDANLAIATLRRDAGKLSDAALAQARSQLARGLDPGEVLDRLARTLTNKLLHAPTCGLRDAAANGDLDQLALMKRIYQLEDGE